MTSGIKVSVVADENWVDTARVNCFAHSKPGNLSRQTGSYHEAFRMRAASLV